MQKHMNAQLQQAWQPTHPRLVRITHWINAVAMLVMIFSGWRIYNAAPIFDFTFPAAITLGNWLGGALLWHFAAMWIWFSTGWSMSRTALSAAISNASCCRSR